MRTTLLPRPAVTGLEEKMVERVGPRMDEPIRFAYRVANVSGGSARGRFAHRTGRGVGHHVELARIAERAGFDSAWTQSCFAAGCGAEVQLEPVVLGQALLAATTRLEVVAALLPGPWSPAVAARQIATLSHMHGARIAVDVVSGTSRGAFTTIGEPWLDHDERHRRAEEFIRALRGIWSEDSFSFAGDFYRFHDCVVRPRPHDPMPPMLHGGSSPAARGTAARAADYYVLDGATPDELGAQARELQAEAAAHGRCVKIGVAAVVVARDTEAEAQRALSGIVEADRQGARTSGCDDRLSRDDGFRADLVGTPSRIAERILTLKDAGAGLVLLELLDPQEDIEMFGRTILPLVREVESDRRAAAKIVRLDTRRPARQADACALLEPNIPNWT